MTKQQPTSAERAADEAIARLKPFQASFYGYEAGDDDWGNSVSIETVTVYDPELDSAIQDDPARAADEAEWAADYDGRQLVRIDTNYKPTRPGEHPVDLSRPDAARFAAAVLEAIEDTFHHARVGQLRPQEAADLLSVLTGVDCALARLREHALGDLVQRVAEIDNERAFDPPGGRDV
jgi:hypothetical protein